MSLGRLGGFGFDTGDSSTLKAVNTFAQTIMVPYMRDLAKTKAFDTGGIYQSIRAEVAKTGDPNSGLSAGEYGINIVIDDPASSYFDFVDKGVKGVQNTKAPASSPYQFGRNSGPRGGLTRSITQWSQRKGLYQYRFGIIKNIYKFGLKARPMLDPTFDYAQRLIETSYEDRLEQGFAEDINKIIDDFIASQN